MPSKLALSLPRLCARSGLLHKLGSSNKALVSSNFSLLASKSKVPPKGLGVILQGSQAVFEIVDFVHNGNEILGKKR